MSDPEELLMLLDSREIDASSEVDEAVKHLKKAVALLGEEEGHDQGDRI